MTNQAPFREGVWETSEAGIKTFRLLGWELTVFPSSPKEMVVESPNRNIEFDWSSEGLWFFGEHSSGYDYSGAGITVPWAVLKEIVRFYDQSQGREVLEIKMAPRMTVVVSEEQLDPHTLGLEVVGASTIAEVCRDASHISKTVKKEVSFDFSGILVRIKPQDDPSTIANEWWRAMYGDK